MIMIETSFLQNYQPAPNLLPVAGVTVIGVGGWNLTYGQETAGFSQALMGIAAVVLSFFVGS
jgi:hypothetical protein